MRIKIIKYFIVGLFIVLASSMFYMQAIKGQLYYSLSTNNRIRVVPMEAQRGRIFDRNNKILVDNRISFDVAIIPQDVEDRAALFAFISKALRVDVSNLQDRFRKRQLTPFAPVVVAEDIPREKAITLAEYVFRFPGLIVQESYRRVYPQGEQSAHVLGYVGRINRAEMRKLKDYGFSGQSFIGRSGVEEFYDQYLRGEEGGRQIEVNSRGQQVRLISFKNPVKGEDITLTIDIDLQRLAQELLVGHRGSIIVMDNSNGDVLALQNSPSFDPNAFVDKTKRNKTRQYFNNRLSPLLNRAISGQYPPGSVFKIPVALAGLKSKKITKHSPIYCPGGKELGGIFFRCTSEHKEESLLDALVHSCNVYFYELSLMIGSDAIRQAGRALGLGKLTEIDLPYERKGRIPSKRTSRKHWYTGNTLNMSIGQGDVLSTPMQLTHMMSVVANSGRAYRPHVIKSIGSNDVLSDIFQTRSFFKKQYEDVREGLRGVVENESGTAYDIGIEGLTISGKTGTAQTGGDREHHAWFAGYTEGANRDISFIVFLEHGGSSHNAVAVARQLLLSMKNNGHI